MCLLGGEPLKRNPNILNRSKYSDFFSGGLTPRLVCEVARHEKGASGQSGLDSEAWKGMLTCFKQSSDRLWAALARFGRLLCTTDLRGVDLSALTAARLIPLDKKPIAVG